MGQGILGLKKKREDKSIQKSNQPKKHAQSGKLQEKHVSKKNKKVLESKEGTIAKRY